MRLEVVMDAAPSAGPRPYDIVGIAGSLRQASFNRALLRAAVQLAPPTLKVTVHDLAALPLYNADVEARAVPEAVAALRTAVRAADGLLVATPEYNHGVPGVLKNAIDWLSRPPRASALDGKAAAIMGASPGMTGTARGQSQLRQSFVFTKTYAMLQPEVLVARAHEKFDARGELIDPATREFVAMFLARFADWVARFVPR
jgi:chromate reductase, NAD(P)H dehydrogenase (quinone)